MDFTNDGASASTHCHSHRKTKEMQPKRQQKRRGAPALTRAKHEFGSTVQHTFLHSIQHVSSPSINKCVFFSAQPQRRPFNSQIRNTSIRVCIRFVLFVFRSSRYLSLSVSLTHSLPTPAYTFCCAISN